jgi:hypothetical protein
MKVSSMPFSDIELAAVSLSKRWTARAITAVMGISYFVQWAIRNGRSRANAANIIRDKPEQFISAETVAKLNEITKKL